MKDDEVRAIVREEIAAAFETTKRRADQMLDLTATGDSAEMAITIMQAVMGDLAYGLQQAIKRADYPTRMTSVNMREFWENVI
jgi:hypothetical protein